MPFDTKRNGGVVYWCVWRPYHGRSSVSITVSQRGQRIWLRNLPFLSAQLHICWTSTKFLQPGHVSNCNLYSYECDWIRRHSTHSGSGSLQFHEKWNLGISSRVAQCLHTPWMNWPSSDVFRSVLVADKRAADFPSRKLAVCIMISGGSDCIFFYSGFWFFEFLFNRGSCAGNSGKWKEFLYTETHLRSCFISSSVVNTCSQLGARLVKLCTDFEDGVCTMRFTTPTNSNIYYTECPTEPHLLKSLIHMTGLLGVLHVIV